MKEDIFYFIIRLILIVATIVYAIKGFCGDNIVSGTILTIGAIWHIWVLVVELLKFKKKIESRKAWELENLEKLTQ